jgi:serine/threonine protein kinase
MIDKDRWSRVENIYHAALSREPQTRDAFLDQVCDGDEEIRREVDSLLKFDERAGSFIERPAVEVAARAMAEDQSPATADEIEDVGPYHLVSLIGQGGTGDVYLAIDTRLGRKVALKLLSADFSEDADRISRFKQEARATSTLSHPNIVTIFEIGEVEHRNYIVTEYVEGETLRARLNTAKPTLKEAVTIATQVVDALGAAHDAGIIHRDIKPENMIVRKDGLVKVLDFGIAKLTGIGASARGDHSTTRTGVVMGTASYMSPEQARGQKVDHRTDIFSVGVMLYEMLSGGKPFEGETWSDVMAAVLIKEPPRLDLLAPQVPPALRRIVERCLEKAPEKRFQSAGDLAFALRQLTIVEAKEVGPAVPAESIRDQKPSSRVAWIVVGIVALAVAVGLLLTKYSPFWIRQVDVRAPRPAITGNKGTRLSWFDRSGRELGTVGEAGEYSSPALSPNESMIVVALNDQQARGRDLWTLSATGALVRVTSEPSDDLNPLWSPDGRWIIYTSERAGFRNIYRKSADGIGVPEPVLTSNEDLNLEDISSDGQLLLFNVRNERDDAPGLGLLALANKTRRALAPAPARAARFSPDGRWVAYESGSGIIIRAMSPNGDASKAEYAVTRGGGTTTPIWRGDGQELFYLKEHTLMSVELQTDGPGLVVGEPQALFNVNIEDEERRNRYVATRDGQRFLVIVKEGPKTLVYLPSSRSTPRSTDPRITARR